MPRSGRPPSRRRCVRREIERNGYNSCKLQRRAIPFGSGCHSDKRQTLGGYVPLPALFSTERQRYSNENRSPGRHRRYDIFLPDAHYQWNAVRRTDQMCCGSEHLPHDRLNLRHRCISVTPQQKAWRWSRARSPSNESAVSCLWHFLIGS